jgi:hypothetical protein
MYHHSLLNIFKEGKIMDNHNSGETNSPLGEKEIPNIPKEI